MKTVQKILSRGIDRAECSSIPHTVCLADFDTSCPNTSRIDRIASEINEYMRNKNKYTATIK